MGGGVGSFNGGGGLFGFSIIFINMSLKQVKRKLKRRGGLYNRYFFNPESVLQYIVECYDSDTTVDDTLCEVVFDVNNTTKKQIYELVMYYPKVLKNIGMINDNVVNRLYSEYGETILILQNHIPNGGKSVRNRLHNGASKRAKEGKLEFNIFSEDIILINECPFLNVPLEYSNSEATDFSPSLDRIDPTKGYVKGNIQVISFLANRMKNSANVDTLLTFSNNVLKMYG